MTNIQKVRSVPSFMASIRVLLALNSELTWLASRSTDRESESICTAIWLEFVAGVGAGLVD
jgi:hypothetical protein